MDKITKIKVRNAETGVVGQEVPIGAAAENVVMSDGRTVEEIIGDLRKYFGNKNIADILYELKNT